MTRMWAAVLLGVLYGCGGSPVAPTAQAPTAQPSPVAVERWAPGLPMHHCFGPEVNVQLAQWAADELSLASGVPQTTAGGCNVEWIIGTAADFAPVDAGNGSNGAQGFADRTFQGRNITHARLIFRNGTALEAKAVHEGGHALGLGHSVDPADVMYAQGATAVRTFSPAERTLLASMYR